MSFPPLLLPWPEIHRRLPTIFPPGLQNREHSIWEISARTIFVMLYAGAIEGRDTWLRPDQVTRMTDAQAARTDGVSRGDWAQASMRPSKGEMAGRWYAVNTRESIRDDTLRYSLLRNGAAIERGGLATTSPAGRYASRAGFAALFDPAFDEATFLAKAEAWRQTQLNAGALARIAIVRKDAGFPAEHVAFVTAFLDRSAPSFRRTVSSLAWGSYAWFASEPERLVILSDKPVRLRGG